MITPLHTHRLHGIHRSVGPIQEAGSGVCWQQRVQYRYGYGGLSLKITKKNLLFTYPSRPLLTTKISK